MVLRMSDIYIQGTRKPWLLCVCMLLPVILAKNSDPQCASLSLNHANASHWLRVSKLRLWMCFLVGHVDSALMISFSLSICGCGSPPLWLVITHSCGYCLSQLSARGG